MKIKIAKEFIQDKGLDFMIKYVFKKIKTRMEEFGTEKDIVIYIEQGDE